MVSIIIPLFNVEGYIALCLNSIENQSYRNFEVIIVNDGSTDSSVDVVNRFAAESRLDIKIINQENQGVSKARNIGIEHAKGNYLCFVDADDILSAHYIKIMREIIEKNCCDVCICGYQTISDESTETDIALSGETSIGVLGRLEALNFLLFGKIQAGIWALMIKKEIMSGLRFAEGYRYSEDLEIVWKAVAASERSVVVDQPLYGYRIRKGSAMSKLDDRRLDGLKLFEALESYLADKVPEFYKTYKKYGVARWVWSTLWQEAAAADNYRDFCVQTEKYQPHKHMKKLLSYPDLKVKLTSLAYLTSKRLYYLGMSAAGKRRRKFN